MTVAYSYVAVCVCMWRGKAYRLHANLTLAKKHMHKVDIKAAALCMLVTG